MNIKVNYLDNTIIINNECINVLEVENKKVFYRLVSDLYKIKNNDTSNEIYIFDENNNEIDLNNKIAIYSDFFDFDLNTKKNLSLLNKKILLSIDDKEKNNIYNSFQKMGKLISKALLDIDLPLTINENVEIEDIIKMYKISINKKDELFDNLLLLIDIENVLNINKLLIFINIKQYLSNVELQELYKYAIYNNVFILLIDSQCYKTKIKYEKKLTIDDDLIEFVL